MTGLALPPGYTLDAPPAAAGQSPPDTGGIAVPEGYTLDAPSAKGEAAAAPKDLPVIDARGRINAALRAATNPFGISDEIGGVIEGTRDVLGGGSFGEGYDRFTKKARAIDKSMEEQYPGETIGGAVVGGMLTGAPAINLLTVPAKVAKAAPIAERIAGAAARTGARATNAAATGGAYGAAAGFASGEGLQDRLAGGFWGGASGAALGAGLGVAVPAVAEGLGWLGQKLKTPFRGIGDKGVTEAARRVAAAQTIDAGSPERAADALARTRKAGIPMVAADLGEASRTLADDARNTSIEGRALLDRTLNARQDTQLERTLSILDQAAPGVNAPQTREMLLQAGRAANKPAYARAYLEGEKGIWHEGLQQLTAAPDMQTAIRTATKTGANKAAVEGFRPPQNPFVSAGDGTIVLKPGVRPTLQFWDNVKQNLDSSIGKAQRAGDNPRARDLTRIKQQLVSYLDEAVPSYEKARAGAASFFGAENALDAGSNFVTMRADDFQEATAAFNKLNASEKALFKEGFVQTLINKLREKGDRQDVVNSIFLKSPAARERIRLALGDEGAKQLEAHLRFENIFALTKVIQGNSATARRMFQMGIAGGLPVGLGLITSGGNLADPKAWAVAALTYGARRGRLKINQNIAREVARLLASNDPVVVRTGLQKVARSPSLLEALRIGEGEIARLAGVGAAAQARQQ